MKILRIIARLNVGGPARHVVSLTRGLDADEFETVLVAGTVPPGEEDMGYLAEQAGICPVFIEEMSRELSPKDVVSLFKIYREMRRQRPDVVHTHTAKAGTIGRVAAFAWRWCTPATLIGKPRRVRIVHTFHGHVFHSYYGKLKTAVFLSIERLLARFATDRIIVISGQQLDEINGRFKIGRREKFTVIPLGIDLSLFSESGSERNALRIEFGAAADGIVAGFVGRLTEIKNIPLLLNAAKAYKELLKNDPRNTPKMRFVIVGDGHLRSELERRAAALGISNIVHFAGNRTDIEKVYGAFDIVVLTSRNEGTPLSLIEAMAAERPVISTLVGGVPDLLGERTEQAGEISVFERGIGTRPDSAEDLRDGLLYLANNEKLRKAIALHSKSFVISEYSRERLIKDIESLYRGLFV